MFDPGVYTERRKKLRDHLKNGVAVFPGNNDSPMNYPANPYHFRQDSSFLYFFGLDQPGLAGVMDFETGRDVLFGNDLAMDDIIWMGDQPGMKERAERAGVMKTFPYEDLTLYIENLMREGKKIHYLPPYRAATMLDLEWLTGVHYSQIKQEASEELIRAVVALRSVKQPEEIEEIDKAVDIAYEMHTTVMRLARPGIYEYELAGAVEGTALSHGRPVSFPVILTINGQILHNHYHGNKLAEGRLMVTDAGTESLLGYASDITRTIPVSGRFDQRQKEIYEIVLKALNDTTAAVKPGITNKQLHLMGAEIIARGLKDLGLMKGDIRQAVDQGAHALFFPHGLGHMMGLDVHDMEGLGENYVGYDGEVQRSEQFGTANLRLGRQLQSGFVLTIEPGIYFIPALIEKWKAEKRFTEYINYEKIESYKDFGGIRIEDDVLVTEDSHRVLGKPIPKTINEIEEEMNR